LGDLTATLPLSLDYVGQRVIGREADPSVRRSGANPLINLAAFLKGVTGGEWNISQEDYRRIVGEGMEQPETELFSGHLLRSGAATTGQAGRAAVSYLRKRGIPIPEGEPSVLEQGKRVEAQKQSETLIQDALDRVLEQEGMFGQRPLEAETPVQEGYMASARGGAERAAPELPSRKSAKKSAGVFKERVGGPQEAAEAKSAKGAQVLKEELKRRESKAEARRKSSQRVLGELFGERPKRKMSAAEAIGDQIKTPEGKTVKLTKRQAAVAKKMEESNVVEDHIQALWDKDDPVDAIMTNLDLNTFNMKGVEALREHFKLKAQAFARKKYGHGPITVYRAAGEPLKEGAIDFVTTEKSVAQSFVEGSKRIKPGRTIEKFTIEIDDILGAQSSSRTAAYVEYAFLIRRPIKGGRVVRVKEALGLGAAVATTYATHQLATGKEVDDFMATAATVGIVAGTMRRGRRVTPKVRTPKLPTIRAKNYIAAVKTQGGVTMDGTTLNPATKNGWVATIASENIKYKDLTPERIQKVIDQHTPVLDKYHENVSVGMFAFEDNPANITPETLVSIDLNVIDYKERCGLQPCVDGRDRKGSCERAGADSCCGDTRSEG
jgi:hypothetical protein